ncbi:hypothetical protein HWC97_gp08 [Flavobacterium phage vB_FspS_snusmum6-1]|uniref:Uncharacterized protein n=3 Tax=Muminvirus snusmum TaxID=2844298 RepID=A0A6B9LFF7_9CAUD|nr:hypothetical protein HWC97_gp08 [Flavobacterium phage vB_FspS_snusmum6-1]QHB40582.1 hypothetical protein snusmum61_gp008 [Flavobacterium phage vB_FspS_snusmum6-1]QHB40654.1 hypothetical protein snusmum62_gp008 [Flavobacterium phage vB_FspS_snusmum6-2]QHB40727.1 hypothetical protein snusmum63_gp008 [Flavobacterium phage vB_FspS_snusmum6-3]
MRHNVLVALCLFAPCTMLQFNKKLNRQIAQNRCYKLAAVN